MARRKHSFETGGYYHCFNRGVEKRAIFCDQQDYLYFLKSLRAYNTEEKLGKLRLYKNRPQKNPPVTILSYCLLPNHFHLLLRNNIESGVSVYLKRVCLGYAMYFNEKYSRTGSLFQGTFKSKSISTEQDLCQVLSYVRFNYMVHGIKDTTLFRTSINTNDTEVRVQNSNFKKR